MVMLHGFAANKDNWVRFARSVPNEYHLIAADLPTPGNTSFDPHQRYDAQSMTTLLAGFLGQVADRPIHLIGNSLGGWVASLYAAEHPDRLLTLTLMDPPGVLPPVASDLQLRLLEGVNPLIVREPADFETLLDFVFHREPFLPWPLRSELADHHTTRVSINNKVWQDLGEHMTDITPLMDRLHIPVLLIWGQQDRIIHVSSMGVFNRHMTDLRVVIREETGHAPIAELPAQTAGYLTSLLSGEMAAGFDIIAPRERNLKVQFGGRPDSRSR